MNQIIAMHGWSGDSNNWLFWEQQFKKKGWVWQSNERGYGNNLYREADWINTEEAGLINERRVVIGHSLGPHLLKNGILSKATHIVLLCSFGRFIPNKKKAHFLRSALLKMKEKLGTKDEPAMLQKFLIKSFHPEPLPKISSNLITKGLSSEGRERLKKDLELLIHSDGIATKLSPNAKVLVIQGESDAIIEKDSKTSLLEELEEHLFNPPTIWNIPKAGHTILVPGLIEKIRDWLEA